MMIAVERVLEKALGQKMSLAEFLASPESGDRYEFVDGQIDFMQPFRVFYIGTWAIYLRVRVLFILNGELC
jgi:hypothetical protein